MRRGLAIAAILWSGGCTCSGAPVSGDPDPGVAQDGPAGGHFSEWGPLVDAVAMGRVDTVHVMARDLTEGEPGGSAEVGSAVGFLQLAEGEELAEGLAAAAVACAACHVEQSVAAPEPGPRGHRAAARRMAVDVAFGGDGAPRENDSDVRRAWDAAEGTEARLAAALKACQGCHAGEPVVEPAVVTAACAEPCMGTVELHRLPGGPVDRMTTQGDLARCSHVMYQWGTVDGTFELRVSDRPVTREQAAAFQERVAAFMGDRVPAASVDCLAPDSQAPDRMR
ncbi:MAG: hypothetical protein H6737_07645 [Alphaproteobacteria bacterium]|nr:hypothetical protein [Alphaproteobacteria bacterium]